MSNQDQHNDFESRCAGYLLGALSDDEAKKFEDQLASASPEELRLYEELTAIRDEMALATEFAEPSDEVEIRIFDHINEKSQSDSIHFKNSEASSSIIPLWVYKAAAALLLLGAITPALITIDLSDTVYEQQTRIFELQSELERQDQLLNVLAAREITLVMMAGLDPSPDGFGKIIWDPENRQAVLQLANLPAPPVDKDYQLWLIKDDENPISAGVFNFEQPSSDLFFKVEQLQEEPSPISNTFAVTLEPKGGMPQPTGDMFLVGAQ